MKRLLYWILLRIISPLIILSRLFWLTLIVSYFVPFAKRINIDLTNNDIFTTIVYIRNYLTTPIHATLEKFFHHQFGAVFPIALDIAFFWIALSIMDSILSYLLWTIKRRYFYTSQRKQLEEIRLKIPKFTEQRVMMPTNVQQEMPSSTKSRRSTDQGLYLALESKLEQLNKAKSKSETEEYYSEFMQMKKKLGSMARYFAFMSLDVVDSTGMKESEDKSLIQLDFMRYKKMVQKIIDDYGCVQSAWTPDGAMISFNTLDNAVEAAKEVIVSLKRFNEQIKKINRDFIVRCGINAGIIYFDEKLKLDEITDVVIDIAGHLQKNASPGAIAITQSAVINLSDAVGFHKTTKVVDGFEVSEWMEDRAEASEPGEEK